MPEIQLIQEDSPDGVGEAVAAFMKRILIKIESARALMELQHLRHFIAVAGELHFARAAERLGMEQSFKVELEVRELGR